MFAYESWFGGGNEGSLWVGECCDGGGVGRRPSSRGDESLQAEPWWGAWSEKACGEGVTSKGQGPGQVSKPFNLAITYYQLKFRFVDSKCLCIQQNSIDNNSSPSSYT